MKEATRKIKNLVLVLALIIGLFAGSTSGLSVAGSTLHRASSQQAAQQMMLGQGTEAPKVWLKGDDVSGLSDGDPASAWEDSSAQNNDGTQATAEKRPLYKTGILNGKPAFKFDGIDDSLQFSTHITSGELTVFIVANKTEVADGYRTLFETDKLIIISRSAGTDEWGVYLSGSYHSGVTLGSDFKLLIVVMRSGTDIDIGTNDALSTFSTAGYNSKSTSMLGAGDAGATNPHPGFVAELLVYHRALSSAEITQKKEYLRVKYSLF